MLAQTENFSDSELGKLLTKADELGFKSSLGLDEINNLINRFSQLHDDWKSHPVTKVFLLALKVERASQLNMCIINATSEMSEVALRSRLSAANQTNKIETYANKSISESCIIRP